MIIGLSSREVIVPKLFGDETSGLRLVSLDGSERRIDVGERQGQLKLDPSGLLTMKHVDGVSVIDPENAFEVTDLSPDGSDDFRSTWTLSFLGTLVDSYNKDFREYELDLEKLALLDPGYSHPVDAGLIPQTSSVAISIARSQHMAIYDVTSEECRLVRLAGSYGSSNPSIRDGRLWVVNYDYFCRVDLETLAVSASKRLQPEIMHAETGRRGSAFVGVPHWSFSLNGWLIPRPYSSDILLVDLDSLEPIGRIKCGGRPHALAEFDDGSLFIINHPFDSFQQASINDLEAL